MPNGLMLVMIALPAYCGLSADASGTGTPAARSEFPVFLNHKVEPAIGFLDFLEYRFGINRPVGVTQEGQGNGARTCRPAAPAPSG